MDTLNPRDEYVLERLVKAGRIDADQADTFAEVLANQQASKPETSMAALLLGRGIISRKEAKGLLVQAAQKFPEASTESPDPEGEEARPEDAEAEERRPVRSPVRRKSPVGIIAAIVVVVLGLGAGVGYLFYEDQQTRGPVAGDTPEEDVDVIVVTGPGEGTVMSKQEYDARAGDANAEVEEVPKLEFAEAQRRYLALLEEERPRQKLDGFFALLKVCPDGLVDEVRSDFAVTVRHYEPLAEAQLEKLSDVISRHLASLRLRDVREIYAKLFDLYGVHVLDGKFKKQLDAIIKQQTELFEENDRDAVAALAEERYELARRIYTRVLTYGEADQITRAQAQLAVIKEKAPDEALLTPEEIAAVKKRVEEDMERARVEREKRARESAAKAKKTGGLPGRLGIIHGRLDDLVAVKKKSLKADGVIEFTYELSTKTFSDTDDWSPPVTEDADMQSPIRWTIDREDVYESRGLKLSDRKGQTGVYFHKVRLLPPVEVQVEFRSINQYNPKNCVAACWVDKKGKGFGGIYGRQLTRLQQFRPLGRKPATMAALQSLADYKFRLEIGPDTYQTSQGATTIGPEPIKKNLTAGHVALVWNGNVNAIVTRLTIKGTLDLDWAEKELGE